MNTTETGGNNNLSTKLLLDEMTSSGLFLVANIVSSFAAFFALFNNAVVLLVCFLKRKKGLPLSRALISFLVADLLMFSAPFGNFSGFYDEDTYNYCDVVTYVNRLASFGTVGNGILVSIERYLAIKYASNFKIVFSKKRATVAISFVWFVAIIFAVVIPNVAWDGRLCNREFTFRTTWTVIQLVVLVTPTVVAMIFYLMAYRSLQKETTNYQMYKKSFITVIIVSSLDFFSMFIVNSFLLNESCGFGEHCGIGGRAFNKALLVMIPIAVTTTSAANPLVTVVRCEEIRTGLMVDEVGVPGENHRVATSIKGIKLFSANLCVSFALSSLMDIQGSEEEFVHCGIQVLFCGTHAVINGEELLQNW